MRIGGRLGLHCALVPFPDSDSGKGRREPWSFLEQGGGMVSGARQGADVLEQGLARTLMHTAVGLPGTQACLTGAPLVDNRSLTVWL